jgi:plastocyanin
VFDVHQGSGTNGKFTYPDDEPVSPYPNPRRPRNVWTVPRAGVLIGGGGHLHPGGLYDDLFLERPLANGTVRKKRIFRSKAVYYEPAGPVSWDVSMTVTKSDWRVRVKPGDRLRMTATYDTATGSWYEAMGIMVFWMAEEGRGANPFFDPVDTGGVVTHGHLPENDNHGGDPTPLPDPRTLPDGPQVSNVGIGAYRYLQGDLAANGAAVNPPVVQAGQSIQYTNYDAPSSGYGTWHTVTACKEPCTGSTGVAFPLANGRREFDSGQLGNAGEPTAGRLSWSTPADLDPGTYSFFCRVHPFMRGAFRVKS